MALVDTATVIVGSPTVLAGPHPLAAYAAFLMNALRPKTRFVGVIGSYGWGGKMVEGLAGALYSLKVELYEPVVIKGYPKEADLQALDKFADEVVKKHAAIGARTCSLGKTGIC
jgi:flavorubredoxin